MCILFLDNLLEFIFLSDEFVLLCSSSHGNIHFFRELCVLDCIFVGIFCDNIWRMIKWSRMNSLLGLILRFRCLKKLHFFILSLNSFGLLTTIQAITIPLWLELVIILRVLRLLLHWSTSNLIRLITRIVVIIVMKW